jgi:glutamine synthetase
MSNLQFLTLSMIKAVHDHESLLEGLLQLQETTIRLGANEAPPAIISVFIGAID